jgi:hypothetical protein
MGEIFLPRTFLLAKAGTKRRFERTKAVTKNVPPSSAYRLDTFLIWEKIEHG